MGLFFGANVHINQVGIGLPAGPKTAFWKKRFWTPKNQGQDKVR